MRLANTKEDLDFVKHHMSYRFTPVDQIITTPRKPFVHEIKSIIHVVNFNCGMRYEGNFDLPSVPQRLASVTTCMEKSVVLSPYAAHSGLLLSIICLLNLNSGLYSLDLFKSYVTSPIP